MVIYLWPMVMGYLTDGKWQVDGDGDGEAHAHDGGRPNNDVVDCYVMLTLTFIS